MLFSNCHIDVNIEANHIWISTQFFLVPIIELEQHLYILL